MGHALVSFFAAIASVDWPKVITNLAPVAAALIAFTALWNWQRQDKAKREAEFLDELIEAALAYMADLSVPITTLEIAKIAISSHAPTWEPGTEDEIAIKGGHCVYSERRRKNRQ